MIRLNLLPDRPDRFCFQPRMRLFLLGGVLFVFAVVLIHFRIVTYHRGLQAMQAEKQIKLRQKQKELTRRRQQRAMYKTVCKQVQILRELRKNQGFPLRLLAAVFNQIGSSRITLHFLELESGGTLRLKGVAFDAQTLAAYMRRLKQGDAIQDIMVIETTTHRVETFAFLHFICQIFPAVFKSKKSMEQVP